MGYTWGWGRGYKVGVGVRNFEFSVVTERRYPLTTRTQWGLELGLGLIYACGIRRNIVILFCHLRLVHLFDPLRLIRARVNAGWSYCNPSPNPSPTGLEELLAL